MAVFGARLARAGDGMVVGAVKVVDNGPNSDRFNLVLVAEGYQDSELGDFASDVQQFIDFFFNTPPFDTNCRAFNIWRLDVSSAESGADDPMDDDPDKCKTATGATANTFFDATFCADGVIRRLLGVDSAKVIMALDDNIAEWDQAIVIVNSSIYGGQGGTPGTTSLSGTWENIAIHEVGHSVFGLADEYEYWAGCNSGETDRDNHPACEPSQPNVTIETDRDLVKWSDLIAAATAVPTTDNADCTVCDLQGNPVSADTVGLFEGAHYYHCDAFRPVFSCMMRDFAEFCPVCTRRILDVLEPYQPDNLPPSCQVTDPEDAECAGTTTSVALDGSGSSDPDCDPLTYSWTTDCPGGVFDDALSPTPVLTLNSVAPCPLTCEATLTVTDDNGASDMCSTTIKIADDEIPSITCPVNLTVECEEDVPPADASLVDSSDVCDPNPAVTFEGDADNAGAGCVGDPLIISRTYRAQDSCGNFTECTQTITVQDTMPPDVECTVESTELWPPNDNMVNVGLDALSFDNCTDQPVFTVQVYSDEDDENQTGDGHHSPDALDLDIGSLRLRAARKGNEDGRVYLVVVTATDECDNASSVCCTVTVAKSQTEAHRSDVAEQAAAAQEFWEANGAAPPGFVVVGDGPVLGPKQ